MTERALIAADRVRIRHDGAQRFTPDGVTLQVTRGEVVLLLGPSGSGKSTFTLALNGLVPHSVPATLDGTVTVAGRDTVDTSVGETSAHVAMVFQDPDAQIVTGKVFDEVCFGPENQLLPVATVRERAERALRQVGLWERRDDNPDHLSGGGKQRLAIACALAMGSSVLVLDEPTANLDPKGIDEIYAVLRELASAHDHAIVLVEHNLDQAIDIVDRVVVFDGEGHLAIAGSKEEVMRERARELAGLGVWLPVSTLAALQLSDAGVGFDRLPITPRELAAGLDHALELPERPSTAERATAAASAAITLSQLTVRRGGKRGRDVVHNVSLSVASGDFLAVVGTNGAGKTSLVQAIAGVLPSKKGSVNVLGHDPATVSARTLAGTIGFVFQNPEHQFVTHSVAGELEHSLAAHDLTGEQRAERVDAMLERFGLTELREQHPFLLSGGQKRRLSVGTALIAGAPILALDEPTFGQDRARAGELLDILSDLHAHGTTVIVVTHDLQLVADHASHVAVMQNGHVTAFDTTARIFASDALEHAGLQAPPLARAMRSQRRAPWRDITRLSELPGGAR